MSRAVPHVDRLPASPGYVGWRGELLAQLALARLSGVAIYRATADQGYDYLLVTTDGSCVFIEVKAFSSARSGMTDVSDQPVLNWRVDRGLIDRARRSRNPVVLFLFDADTEHGRFLRMDTLPAPGRASRMVSIGFPIENTIDQHSLERLLSELRDDGRRTGTVEP